MSLKTMLKPVWKAGFTEKDVILPDNTVINYAESPNNGKQALLLIHGQTGAWQDYSTVLAQLAENFHVFAVDCHGHGKSQKNPEKYKAKEIGKDLTWFIDAVIGSSAVVSGHSSGGLIAAWLAANSPKSVSSVVLEDPPFFSTEPAERWEKSFAYLDAYEPMHRFLNQTEETDWTVFYLKNSLWKKFMGKLIAYGEKYRKKHPHKPLYYFFLPQSINRMFYFMQEYDLCFGETFYNLSWFEDYDQVDVVSKITCPAVLIHTKSFIDKDGILIGAMSKDDASRANSLIPSSELIYIDSGHNFHVEKPKEFLKAFHSFVKTD